MTERISLPPIKVSNSYLALQQKRSRGSWWDPKTDKTAQIQRVKAMVRHSGHSSSVNPVAPAAEPHTQNSLLLGDVAADTDSSDSSDSNDGNNDSNNDGNNRVFLKEESFKYPIPPKIRKKSLSDTPRLQYLTAVGVPTSSGILTEKRKTTPAETQTDSDKTSVDNLKESIENYKKIISKQNAYFKRLELLSSDISSDTIKVPDLKYSLVQFLQENNYEATLIALQADMNISESTANHIRLRTYMKNLDFINALNYVEYFVSKEMSRSRLIAYEDLIYVLTKYRFIRLCQKKELEVAKVTLEEDILQIVQREQQRSGVRANWFVTDYHLLSALLNPKDLSEGNLYGCFNWINELTNFWESVRNLKQEKGSSVPLYAHILLHYFWDDCENIPNLGNISLESEKWKMVNLEMQKVASKLKQDNLKEASKINENTIMGAEIKSVSSDQNNKKGLKRSFKGIRPKISASYSNSSYNDEFNSSNVNNIMLPISKDAETAAFALSNNCGPTLSQIRVLEICTGLKDGSFICASAGDDSKSDRCISIWDIRTGTLIKRIDNGSNKAIIILYFHPIYTNLIFSVDMDFDIKLWDWETGEMQKSWKKHHSRIIHKIELLPGTRDTMVSCSGDQSLKLWDIGNSKVPYRSIHANEPITSFVFCGSPSDPTQQKIVISLSYSIRIYKLRTLGIIHNIPLKELKENKTPISMMQSHPMHENYVLISSDNHLRLFDLLTGTTLRVFATRHIETGTRIEGRFSPYGNFVYCGNCDLRAYSALPIKKFNETNYPRSVTGIFIWRVQTGKLEIDDMRAMTGQNDTPAVFVARWYLTLIIIRGIVSSGSTSRKVLLQATLDKQLRIYY